MTHDKSTARGLPTKWIAATWVLTLACEPAAPPAAPPPAPPPPAPAAAVPAQPVATAAAPLTAAPAKPAIPTPILVKDAGLKTPESVLYDAEADIYFVSNINGKPTDEDDNGFISKVDAEGKMIELAFIDGAKKEIKLNAPKGMAVVGDTLYVADLTVVRVFDKKTGKSKGEIRAPKATFLNDISPGQGTKLFLSDSGMKMGKEGLEPNGSDAVFLVDSKAANAKVIRANKDLLGPNGVLADEDGAYVVTQRSNELYRLNKKGEREQVTALPKGGLDGIVRLSDGTLLVSSWEAGAIFRGRPGGTFEPILSNLTSPADIGLDTKRNRVLIPSFLTDTVIIQPLPELAPIPVPAPAVPPDAKPTDPKAPGAGAAKPGEGKGAPPAGKPGDAKGAAAPPPPPAKPGDAKGAAVPPPPPPPPPPAKPGDAKGAAAPPTPPPAAKPADPKSATVPATPKPAAPAAPKAGAAPAPATPAAPKPATPAPPPAK